MKTRTLFEWFFSQSYIEDIRERLCIENSINMEFKDNPQFTQDRKELFKEAFQTTPLSIQYRDQEAQKKALEKILSLGLDAEPKNYAGFEISPINLKAQPILTYWISPDLRGYDALWRRVYQTNDSDLLIIEDNLIEDDQLDRISIISLAEAAQAEKETLKKLLTYQKR